ncbi:hypothetical protein E2C01_099280 [Portunus trituberculatus]|uniref:Uncharacterized protein n=1 Tax=Portunus trituberculatus TaxID=210409 RepID=A0A5B7KEI0_PORTR|nr:hypothetical protein [Portunus trituberculatus]
MSVSTTSSPFIKSPAVTICPAARLSCRRLAYALLQELTNATNQTTDSSSASASSRDRHIAESLLPQLYAVADCCKTLQRKLPVPDLLTLGCKPPNMNEFVSVSSAVI